MDYIAGPPRFWCQDTVATPAIGSSRRSADVSSTEYGHAVRMLNSILVQANLVNRLQKGEAALVCELKPGFSHL